MNTVEETTYEYGVIGLGTMGRNLVLNMSDHGFSVAGFDKEISQTKLLQKEANGRKVFTTSDLDEFINALKTPRAIILLVPAGKIVDEVIKELKPLLSENDLLMDWGNSHFTDTDLRIEELQKLSVHFMGIGISGGESGARFGPSIMPGGAKKVYARISDMLKAISAKYTEPQHSEPVPCVTWLGPGSAGHYVKMVHNGIEYGIMQLISELYHLLKVVGGLSNDELHDTFSQWNKGALQSFLIEITANIFAWQDELTNNRLIEMISDSAAQKGTGKWTSENALELQIPLTVIDMALSMRNLSALKNERMITRKKLTGPGSKYEGDKNGLIVLLEQALYFSIITTYAQGMSLLYYASKAYSYDLKLEDIARIWRGGCIIRSSLLEDICSAFSHRADLSNILMDDGIAQKLMHSQIEVRKVIHIASQMGIPIPAMMASLAYYDSYSSGWLPANLIQAQRDYFGAHTYQRNDRKGTFHTEWNKEKN